MEDVEVVCRRELVQGKNIANVGPSYLRGHKVHRGGIPKYEEILEDPLEK